jgi:hypothetical protein
MTKDPQFTEEVRRALGMDRQPAEPVTPEGQVRYLIAIQETQQAGTAPPAVVAALLRAQADSLDPPKPVLERLNHDPH